MTLTSPASIGQRMVWMAEHYRPFAGAFNIPLTYRVSGPLDLPALTEAVRLLSAHHEALRTTLHRERGRLVQRVEEPRDPPLRVHGPTTAATAEDLVRADLAEPVDAAAWPLRLTVVGCGRGEYMLSLVSSHLACDGWSADIMARDLGILYSALVEGCPASLAPVIWRYRDFAAAQAEVLSGARLRKLRDYWSGQLVGARPARLGPETGVRPSFRIERFEIPSHVVEALTAVARHRRGSLFAALLTAMNTVVAERTGDPDVTVGSVYANRTRGEVLNTVGCFAHVLALRTVTDMAATFAERFDMARATVNGAFAHQELPRHMLPPRLMDGDPSELVFHVMSGPAQHPRLSGLEVDPLVLREGIGGRWGLELLLTPTPCGGMRGDLYHDVNRYDAAWAAGLATAYLGICEDGAKEARR